MSVHVEYKVFGDLDCLDDVKQRGRPVFALAALVSEPRAFGVEALELCLLLEQRTLLALQALTLRFLDAHLLAHRELETGR